MRCSRIIATASPELSEYASEFSENAGNRQHELAEQIVGRLARTAQHCGSAASPRGRGPPGAGPDRSQVSRFAVRARRDDRQ